jgi:hypothetical protein
MKNLAHDTETKKIIYMHESPVFDKVLVQLVEKHGPNDLDKVRDDLILLVGEVASKLGTEVIKSRYEHAKKISVPPGIILPSSYMEEATDDDDDTDVVVFQPPTLIPKSVFLQDTDDESGGGSIRSQSDPYSRCRLIRERISGIDTNPEFSSDEESESSVQLRDARPWKECKGPISEPKRGLEKKGGSRGPSPMCGMDTLSKFTVEQREELMRVTERCRKNVTLEFPNKRVLN